MLSVPFTKAHGCGNDFLIVPAAMAPAPLDRFVRDICDRHFGIGADGVYLVSGEAGSGSEDADRDAGVGAEIQLYNSDGSRAELSGNGTRCVAAALAHGDHANSRIVRIRTGAGIKELRLLQRDGNRFQFEMRVGPARVTPGPEQTLSVWLGNPQCVALVDHFEFDWQARGRALERHPDFPNGTNVDFVRPVDLHAVEARFWERGAGHTLSSGTGSSASAVAAIHAGRAGSPVRVRTEGGELEVRWEPGSDVYLTGPAEITGRGEFFWRAPTASEE